MWVAGLIYAVVSAVLWQLAGGIFIPELLANWFFGQLPATVIEAGVQLLGPLAKQLGFVGWVVAYFAAYILFAYWWPQLRQYFGNPFFGSGFLWAAHLLILFPLTGFGLLGARLPQGALGGALILFANHWIFARMLQSQARRESLAGPVLTKGRRRALALVGLGALLVGGWRAWWIAFRPGGRVRDGSGVFPDIDGLSQPITPTADFYTVSKNSIDPVVRSEGWSVDVKGLVDRPQRWTYEEFVKLPAVDLTATLACISNPVGGDWIGNAVWRGVPLGRLLEEAGVQRSGVDVVFHASDGYADSIPISRALHPSCLLAHQMNGEPLTSAHGYPLRLIVPGIYGMKNVKWITSIEVVDHDFRGFWQVRGWDDSAPYKTISRIDVARNGQVAGVAFAGDRGVSRVEVSVDAGVWQPARTLTPMSPLSWVLWHWTGDIRGKRVRVRATDGAGAVQTDRRMEPFPEGSSGWHELSGE